MNRNVESHFSMLPSADIQRSRFDRSQDVKFTFNVGELIPFYVDEVLPGDTFDITTSKVVRMQTLLTPVMDNIYLDTYWFFVPNRLVWTHWRNLMGENTESAWLPETEYSVPVIKLKDTSEEGDGAVKTGDIADYMGIPVNVSAASDASANIPEFIALPLRSYQLIFNDWFRSENLTDPVNLQTGDTNYSYGSAYVPKKPYLAAKYHDYFTSALPSPQKGPSVSVPTTFIAQSAGASGIGWPVMTPLYGDYGGTYTDSTNHVPLHLGDPAGTNRNWLARTASSVYVANSSGGSAVQDIYPFTSSAQSSTSDTRIAIVPNNLFASPATNDSSGLFVNVNDLRYAFQLQKLYERDARGGLTFRNSGLRVKKIEEKIWKAA